MEKGPSDGLNLFQNDIGRIKAYLQSIVDLQNSIDNSFKKAENQVQLTEDEIELVNLLQSAVPFYRIKAERLQQEMDKIDNTVKSIMGRARTLKIKAEHYAAAEAERRRLEVLKDEQVKVQSTPSGKVIDRKGGSAGSSQYKFPVKKKKPSKVVSLDDD